MNKSIPLMYILINTHILHIRSGTMVNPILTYVGLDLDKKGGLGQPYNFESAVAFREFIHKLQPSLIDPHDRISEVDSVFTVSITELMNTNNKICKDPDASLRFLTCIYIYIYVCNIY